MIEIQMEGDCLVARPTVQTIFERETTDHIYSQIHQQVESGFRKVVIDFSEVESISSNFIGMLVRLKKDLLPEGGDIRLCHLNERLQEIAKITKLHELLGIYPKLDKAVASFVS